MTSPVMVGRAASLETLQRLIDAAAGDGAVRVALVAGDAGIGKSRLVREARAYATAQGYLVLEGACFPQDRACPYAPLIEMLRARLVHDAPADLAAAIGPYARDLSPLLPDLIPAPTDAPPPALDPQLERRRLFAALAHCLAGPAVNQPLLMVAEDLHWSDDASLDFLFYLARRAIGQPLLLLGTYRPEDADARLRDWLAQLGRERLVQELTLAPLTRDEVGALLAAYLSSQRQPPAELLDTIYALAEGNPFYVEELLGALVAAGDVVYANGAWDLGRRPIAQWRIPRSLHDTVQRRVASLSPAARAVLALAAVIGRRFDFALLERLAHVDQRGLLDSMKELIAAHLVVEESRDRFAFRHALTRQAVYAELLGRERAALHRAVAEAAELLASGAPDGRLDDLAHHFSEAEVWDKALSYAQRAGERAHLLYAPRAAVEHFTRALDAARHLAHGADGLGVRSPTLAALHHERGHASETLGDFDAARADYHAAVELARASGDRRTEWRGLIDLGMLWAGRDYEQAGPHFQQALDLARALDDTVIIGHSLNRVGNWRVNTARPRDALALHREALAIFEALDDRQGIAATLDLLGMASFLCADLAGSMAYSQRATTLFHALDDRAALVTSLSMLSARAGSYELGSTASSAGDFAAAIRDAEQALQLARDIGWRAGEAFVLAQFPTTLGLIGDYGRALELGHAGLRVAEEIEHRQWQAYSHWVLGHTYLDLLALPRARWHLERALALAHEVRSAFWVQLVSGCLAWAHALARDFRQAEAVLGPTPDVHAPVESLGERWVNFGHLQLALARRDPALALRLADRASATALDGTRTPETPRPALARGEALFALQRWEEAESVLRAVRELTRRQGARPQLWRSHAALGNLYRAQGRGEEAQREFWAARTTIQDLATNLPNEALRAEFLRGATAALPRPYRLSARPVAAAKYGGLTEREREVAVMIARSRSNREIAEALVLGERTIETHVSNILAKLGATSRRAVAAWATESGLLDDPAS